MSTFEFASPSKFFDSVTAKLSEKARQAIDDIREDLVEETEVEPEDEDDLAIMRNVADSVKLQYTIEVEDGEGSLVVDDDNEQDVIDAFFDALDAKGIIFDVDADDEEFELDEDSVNEARLLKRTKPLDKLKRKNKYRKNKAKIKLKAKKFRRTAKFKKFKAKSKRLNKLGKTSTGKRQTRRK